MPMPTEYRKYAEECERLAREGKPEHRKILRDIAQAWLQCAEQAEGVVKPSNGNPADGALPDRTRAGD